MIAILHQQLLALATNSQSPPQRFDTWSDQAISPILSIMSSRRRTNRSVRSATRIHSLAAFASCAVSSTERLRLMAVATATASDIDETDHLTDFFKHALNVNSFCILRMNVTPSCPSKMSRCFQSLLSEEDAAHPPPVCDTNSSRINSNPFDWNKTQSTPCVRCKPVNLGSAMIGTLCFFASEISRSAP